MYIYTSIEIYIHIHVHMFCKGSLKLLSCAPDLSPDDTENSATSTLAQRLLRG